MFADGDLGCDYLALQTKWNSRFQGDAALILFLVGRFCYEDVTTMWLFDFSD